MGSDYATVLDAGAATLPILPLVLVVLVAAILIAIFFLAMARGLHPPMAIMLGLSALCVTWTALVVVQYWTLWDARQGARAATNVSVAMGRLDLRPSRQEPNGIFLDTRQRFAVAGIEFEYHHRALRFLPFLVPQTEFVVLPLFRGAPLRITYQDEGVQRRLLKFEIAKSSLMERDWPVPAAGSLP